MLLFGEIMDAPLTSRFFPQLEVYAREIFESQPLRPFVYGFIAITMRSNYSCFAARHRYRPPMRLVSLFNSSRLELGAQFEIRPFLLEGKRMFVDDYLGRGRTASAYTAKMDDSSVVVKHLQKDYKQM